MEYWRRICFTSSLGPPLRCVIRGPGYNKGNRGVSGADSLSAPPDQQPSRFFDLRFATDKLEYTTPKRRYLILDFARRSGSPHYWALTECSCEWPYAPPRVHSAGSVATPHITSLALLIYLA